MTSKLDRGVEQQRQYYTDSAADYEQMHEHEGSGDALGNQFVFAVLRMIEARSILDVGTATGRGVRNFKEALPEAFVCGIEPVAALRKRAVECGNTAFGPIIGGSGEALPFPDSSFDAVCEFGVLHHAPHPNAVVKEMLRVARKAVLISDSNRFGQGTRLARLIKLGLYKSKLWRGYNYVRTAGKGYQTTSGDGISYSYSVYDSFELISEWASRIILFSDVGIRPASWLHPLLNSSGVLVCGLKE